MKTIERMHEKLIVGRRAKVLSRHLAELLWPNVSVLDVGCGDGQIASLVQSPRHDVTISGVDVLVRKHTFVPVKPFDGVTLPFEDYAFDVVTFVDVLHHTMDPLALLREAGRVCRRGVIIKDHTLSGVLAGPTLKFMDLIGNGRHGVALPFNYWSPQQWNSAFTQLNWTIDERRTSLGLYPFPVSLLFGRSLHFVARLLPR